MKTFAVNMLRQHAFFCQDLPSFHDHSIVATEVKTTLLVLILDSQHIGNIAVVLSQDELDEIKLLAAQSCPTAAITIDNVETGERVWPM